MNFSIERKTLIGLTLVVCVLVIVSLISYRSMTALIGNFDRVAQTQTRLAGLEAVLSHADDAETGQRGYLITGEDRYLEPYAQATRFIEQYLRDLDALMLDDNAQRRALKDVFAPTVAAKLAELKETIELRCANGFEAARRIVLTDRGKRAMDDIRCIVNDMKTEEANALARHTTQVEVSAGRALLIFFGGVALDFVLLALVYLFIAREIKRRTKAEKALREAHDELEARDYLHMRGRYSAPDAAPRPGLILLDLNMPKMDGREALKEIKADAQLRQIPVVVLTTSKAEEDIYRTYDLGVSSFITKLVTFEALVEILRTLTEYWFEIVELPSENKD